MRWIRVAARIADDQKIDQMAARAKADPFKIVGHLVTLWGAMTEQAKDGNLSAVADATLERWAGWNGKRGAFAAGVRAELCGPDGVVTAWERYQGAAIREAESDRRRADERRKSAKSPADSPADGSREVGGKSAATNTITNTNKSKDQKHTAADAAERAPKGPKGERPEPDGFDAAWAAYPARAGGNPRQAAAAAYGARLAEGATPAELLAGTARYRAYCDATGATGGQYVKQAATFFGPQEHFRETWAPPPRKLTPEERIEADMEARAAAELARVAETAVWLATRDPAARNGNGTHAPAVTR